METALHPIIALIQDQGVPLNTVVVLLLFPVIATFVIVLRQVFGLQAFGIYTPSIVTVVFLAMGFENISNIRYPIAIYIIVLTIGMLMRYILKYLRLLYLPRVGLMLTIISLSVLASLTIAGYFDRTGFAAASFFPLLIIITLVEKFVSVQIEKGSRTAIVLALETLAIAIIGCLIMSPTTPIGDRFIATVLAYPYVTLFIIPVHIFLGKWTGLRLSEYIRFRSVIQKLNSTKKRNVIFLYSR